jgi:hypothetical protein
MANSSTRIHPRVNPNARRIFHASAVIDAPLQLFLRTRGSDPRWLWLAARTSLRIFVYEQAFLFSLMFQKHPEQNQSG